VVACRACGTENPDGFKFCGACGTELAPVLTPASPSGQERRLVTALFCDLVGFTAASEAADPEDVDEMLAAYEAMARGQVERHGGAVEKFIGDAVVGVFGVPTAHEDDAVAILSESEGLMTDAVGTA
jgi:class 3 adenylate cyclase